MTSPIRNIFGNKKQKTSNDFLFRKSQGEKKPLIKPRRLCVGDTIGIFTPSWPGHIVLSEKYEMGIQQLTQAGFKCVEGDMTAKKCSQGYRMASPKERAEEFMSLILNPNIQCLMSSIGGSNSSSLIPYLDFEAIAEARKIICGYSDMTSLHAAINQYSGLSTFYGPAVIPSFGEASSVNKYTLDSFLDLSGNVSTKRRAIHPPSEWSNQFIDATAAGWNNVPREFNSNLGWQTLSPGKATAPIFAADLETLLASAGTPHFPDLSKTILLIEEMDAPLSKEERNLCQLNQMGVLDSLAGLIISKPYQINLQGAPFTYEDLILETIGDRSYPIISNFDCGHTFPMISIAQGMKVSLKASKEAVSFFIEEPSVEEC